MGVDISLTGVPNFDQLELVKVMFITTSGVTVSPSGGQYASAQSIDQVAHGLPYIPVVLAFLTDDSGTLQPLPFTNTNAASTSAAVWQSYSIIVDTVAISVLTQLTSFASAANEPSFSVKCYLLRSKGNR